ncbi:MAG: hypothetical protein ACI4OP_05275 [Candidatus Coprovivens sp.]
MKLEDTFRMLCSAYYGVREMDEYLLKEFVLKQISDYIKQFVHDNPISDFDYEEEAKIVEETWELKTKLQDSLIVLLKVDNTNIELSMMIKARLIEIRNDELKGVI